MARAEKRTDHLHWEILHQVQDCCHIRLLLISCVDQNEITLLLSYILL